jgi:membrane protein
MIYRLKERVRRWANAGGKRGRAIRVLAGTVKGFLDNHCSLYAAGLTYFGLLALIPALCCILVAAKTAGVDRYAKEQINGRLDAWITSIEKGPDDELARLAPASEEERRKRRIAAEEFARTARDISNELFARIEQFDVGTFGWIGFGFLLWTLVGTLGQVEICFNEIWGGAKPRALWKRALVYPFLMVVLPILAAVAMSAPILQIVRRAVLATAGATELTKRASEGVFCVLDSRLFGLCVTLVFASVAFGSFFWIMPTRDVRPKCALAGGVLTAVLFGAWMKICSIAQVGIARSSALYGSFAFLPIVLAWLYMSWQIVLLGACVTRALEDGKGAGR